jgi:competence protein ComEC
VRVVAAIPASALVIGSAAGLIWPEVSRTVVLIVLAVSLFAAVHAFLGARTVVFLWALALAFAAGAWVMAAQAWHAAWRPPLRLLFESMSRDERMEAMRAGRAVPEDAAASMVLVGVLRQDASPSLNGVSLSMRTTWAGRARSAARDPAANPSDGGVLLTVLGSLSSERMRDWRRGRTVRVPALLRRPARYLDPGAPDQERALARRGTTLVGTVKSGALVEMVAKGSQVAELSAATRAFARRAIESAVGRWSAQSAAIVAAIVIGDRTGLDDRVQERLQEAGTYHVIAISGGNIAILAALTLGAFRLAGVLGRSAMLMAIAGLVGYAYLVGGGASVDRATLMAVVYFAGRAIDLRGPPLNSLFVVAGLLVVSDPLAVADPAFLLTFGATAAILIVAPFGWAERLPRIVRPLGSMLVASAAAEAALIPVAAAVFSRVTFAGLVLNFAAIPLMGVAQIAGMLVVPVFALSPALAGFAGLFAHLGAEGLVRTADLVTLAPMVTWRVAPPSPIVITAYYAGIAGVWLSSRGRERRWPRSMPLAGPRPAAMAVAASAAFWILAEPWAGIAARGDGLLHVTFLDVGQGDAAFVRFPRGDTLVVDAGGLGTRASFDVGDRVVAPVLRASGVRRLGSLVLTHGDADHIGGAAALVHEFRPPDIWEGVPVPPFEPLIELRQAARDERLRWRNVQTNDLLVVDDVAVVVRHPDPPDWERQDVRNDDSVVVELLWRDASVVLAGDIGREVERTIASRFAPSPLRVVKVPHHGSLTSSSDLFVHALAPRVAVVSVGRSNNFGHPAPAVLARYRAAGAEVFRTDQDGAVAVDTDGHSLSVTTFTGRKAVLLPGSDEAHESQPINAP